MIRILDLWTPRLLSYMWFSVDLKLSQWNYGNRPSPQTVK